MSKILIVKIKYYSTVRYDTVQDSTVQYSTVQYSTVQYNTIQYSTVQYSTVQYSTVQYPNPYSTVLDKRNVPRAALWLCAKRGASMKAPTSPITGTENSYSMINLH